MDDETYAVIAALKEELAAMTKRAIEAEGQWGKWDDRARRLEEAFQRIAIPEGRFFLSELEAQEQGIEQYWAYERGCGDALAMVRERVAAALQDSTPKSE